MKLISHRGNINGKNIDKENNPYYIMEALSNGFDVELDVRWNNGFYLGHDNATYEVSDEFLYREGLWIHCKDLFTFKYLIQYTNCFYHTDEDFVLTSKGYIWTYPGNELCDKSVCVLPEIMNYTKNQINMCFGICSDKIINYK